ncbi:MAG: ORF6N domain-containing protein [Elusimicrobia bacterium]|jgi:hypothetical protein|nr:ORF6N domain-containing protein [Elusimicrobiota bacterium]
MSFLIPEQRIHEQIYLIRGHKVMMDKDLATLYGVPTKVLNQAVRRNLKRFPDDFMFQLSLGELRQLNRSQIVTGSQKHRDPKARPYVFTEQGVAMLSGVLRSPRAIDVNIAIMRAFVRLRQGISLHRDLARRIAAQEKRTEGLTDYVQKMFDLIHPLLDGPTHPIRKIGFEKRS